MSQEPSELKFNSIIEAEQALCGYEYLVRVALFRLLHVGMVITNVESHRLRHLGVEIIEVGAGTQTGDLVCTEVSLATRSISVVTAEEPNTPLGGNGREAVIEQDKFFSGHTMDQLADLQGVSIQDASILSGGIPETEDIDEALREIYEGRSNSDNKSLLTHSPEPDPQP